MLKKNQLLLGFLIGALLPVICWFLDDLKWLPELNKPAIPYLLVMLCNLFFIRYCFKKGLSNTASGIMLASFIFAILLYWLKFKP